MDVLTLFPRYQRKYLFPIQEIDILNSALIMEWKFSVNKVTMSVHGHIQTQRHLQTEKGILKGTY